VVFSGAAAYAALAGPFFRIECIDARVPESSRDAVARAVPLEANLLLFDTSEVTRVVASDPLVDAVTVDKVLPDTVRVETSLRTGLVRVRAGDQYFEADREGVAFRAAVGDELPLLTGVPPISRPGEMLEHEAIHTSALWLDALERYDVPRVVKIDYLGEGACNLALEDGRLIKLGDTREVDRKLAAAEAILAHWPGDMQYVDVAVTSQPVVGQIPAPEPEDEGPGSPDGAETAEQADSPDGRVVTDAQL
jgi:cell division septal protein FtsQ